MENRSFIVRLAVGGLGVGLVALALLLRLGALTADPYSRALSVVALVYAGALLLRAKEPDEPVFEFTSWFPAAAGVAGAALAVLGLLLGVHQAEWLGLLLVALAALHWALPAASRRDLWLAGLVIYWVHPLPAAVFGPLEIHMQRLAVAGAEWLLQARHHAVWADGLILHTAQRAVEVPAACSGLQALRVALLGALGAGLLARLGVFSLGGLGLLAAAQVLAFNILRIAVMAAAAGRHPPEWSATALHDTTGLFLLVAIALIQVEVWLWQWAQRVLDERAAFTTPGADAARELYQWRQGITLARLGYTAAALLAVLGLAAGIAAVDRRSPAYRAERVGELADLVAATDPDLALRAAEQAADWNPAEARHQQRVIRLLLARRQYEAAMDQLGAVRNRLAQREASALTLHALLGAGHTNEADRLLRELPLSLQADPAIAITAAELAAARGDFGAVETELRRAAALPANLGRIRGLFPRLALRERWTTIAELDGVAPYREGLALHAALAAAVVRHDTGRAEELLTRNRALWQDSPAFLPFLALLASGPAPGPWADEWAAAVLRLLPRLGEEDLIACFPTCFEALRPDLAWLVYRRLERLDANHPGLWLAAARYADRWYVVRPTAVGLPARVWQKELDLHPLLPALTATSWAGPLLRQVPLAERFAAQPPESVRRMALDRCLNELRVREQSGPLPYSLLMCYADALRLAGRLPDAATLTDRMERDFPDRRNETLAQRACVYHLQRDWQRLYETLRELPAADPLGMSRRRLLLIEALAGAELEMSALDEAERAYRASPRTVELGQALARLWSAYGHAEEALFVQTASGDHKPSAFVAGLCERTGRFGEADRLAAVLGLPPAAPAERQARLLALPSAEMALAVPTLSLPTPAEREAWAAELDRRIASDASPFVKAFHGRVRDWYRGRADSAQPALWEAAGRDAREKTAALHTLALLTVRTGDTNNAQAAVARALELTPDSCILWRLRVALTGGEPTALAEARRRCPADPELWLAALVRAVESGAPDGDVVPRVARAAEAEFYSPGTFVRAAGFLLARGRLEAARTAAAHAVRHGRGLLPAYAVGVDCALAARDRPTARQWAQAAAGLAPDPAPYLVVMARLASEAGASPAEQLPTLQRLTELRPADPEWSLRCGVAAFEAGAYEAGREAFGAWLLQPPTNAPAGVLIVMAETARKTGDPATSLRILRLARSVYPGNPHVLNNLVYGLAQEPGALPEALELLPALAALPPTPSVLDTTGVVRWRAGNLEEAARHLEKAVAMLGDRDPSWREVHANAARVESLLGHVADAEALLKKVSRHEGAAALLLDERLAAAQAVVDEARSGAPRR